MTKKLIIDCDPGVDDALAIIYAFSQSDTYYDITILTVAGNVGVNQTTANALRLMALLRNDAENGTTVRGRHVRVIKGCATSLDGTQPSAASVHGRDGMGEVPLRFLRPERNIKKATECLKAIHSNILGSETNAVEFLVSLPWCRDGEKYDLVCTGPLTNIATALHILGPEKHAEFWKCFNHVVVMGGAVRVPGNITPVAEFNFFADPIAARVIFASWEKREDKNQKLYLVPLDVTEQVALLWQDIDPKYSKKPSHIHVFVTCMLQKYFFFHGVQANPVYAETETGERIPSDQKEQYRRAIADQYKKKKIGGSSGVKLLPRFCFLHDPLAMHVNFNIDTLSECFTKERIRIMRDLGESRGMSVAVTGRPRPVEALIDKTALHAEGTLVHMLDPEKFIGEPEGKLRKKLKDAIKKAL